jgi:hypothetical protein
VIIIYSLDGPKSIFETEKTLKTLSSGQIYIKKTQKKPKNPPKNQKPTGLVFFNPGFFQPCLQERVGDEGDGTVLVDGAVVALQARREVRQVVGQLLDHQGSHLPAPDRLRSVIFTCEICPIRSFL